MFKFILTLAWRNIWRNRLRSLIYLLATTVGISLTLFTLAVIDGFVQSRIKDLIELEASHLQVHQKDFLEERELGNYIPQANSLKDLILNQEGAKPFIKGISTRQIIDATIASAYNNRGVQISGLDREEELKINSLNDFLVDGNFLEGKKRILVSEKIAEKLRLKIRSKVVISFQNLESDIISDIYRVGGIFKSPNSVFDENHVFVKQEELEETSGLGEKHEMRILLNNNDQVEEFKAWLTSLLSKKQLLEKWPNLEIKAWDELFPGVAIYREYIRVNNLIIFSLILIGLGFILINIINLIIQERLREIMILRSIGFKAREMFLMLVIEGNLLTLLGCMIGLLFGTVFIVITAKTGINLFEGFESFGFRNQIFPVFKFINLVLGVALSFLMSFLIGSIPSLKVFFLKFEKVK